MCVKFTITADSRIQIKYPKNTNENDYPFYESLGNHIARSMPDIDRTMHGNYRPGSEVISMYNDSKNQFIRITIPNR